MEEEEVVVAEGGQNGEEAKAVKAARAAPM
jgi:hypothetical protein